MLTTILKTLQLALLIGSIARVEQALKTHFDDEKNVSEYNKKPQSRKTRLRFLCCYFAARRRFTRRTTQTVIRHTSVSAEAAAPRFSPGMI